MRERLELSFETSSLAKYRHLFAETENMMGLLQKDNTEVPDKSQAKNYLGEATMPFLRRAAGNADFIYIPRAHAESSDDPTFIDAQLAFVIFSFMRTMTESELIPTGFSRVGLLHAPQSSEEFKKRIVEIQKELGFVVSGIRSPYQAEARLRTRSFFHTGANLLLHVPVDVLKEQFNQMLDGVKIDLYKPPTSD